MAVAPDHQEPGPFLGGGEQGLCPIPPIWLQEFGGCAAAVPSEAANEPVRILGILSLFVSIRRGPRRVVDQAATA